MLPVSIRELRERYRAGTIEPSEVLEAALGRANSNAGANVYLTRDEAWSRSEVDALSREDFERQPLWGVPVSLKDCFDLSGFVTTYGSKALAKVVGEDSAVAARLRAAGAVITGKTHLHQLAYGITGESCDFGDCLQPGAAHLLTGGSSSGAAASVLEGSAMAAIGTDTGGSIRVPAAFCGLVGYRASWTLGERMWRGAGHLAKSFDTLGWLYRDAGDGPLLGAALFGLPMVASPSLRGLRVGVVGAEFLHDCEPEVLAELERWIRIFGASGAIVERFDAAMWGESMEIFTPIQASEAAALHPEPRDVFELAIAERLRWGAGISAAEIDDLRGRLSDFRRRNEERLAGFDVLMLPSSPVAELRAGEDQSGARARILRYTSPISLLGWPAVTLPSRRGAPVLVGKMGWDEELLALSAAV
jgi:Asp-tRNA(Asn)/Glu-tRNA(Gln) amidotransferase A subunit family amidase